VTTIAAFFALGTGASLATLIVAIILFRRVPAFTRARRRRSRRWSRRWRRCWLWGWLATIANVSVAAVHPPAATAAFQAVARCIASHATLGGTVIHANNEVWASSISIVRRRLGNWNGMIDNLDVCTTVPDLVCLLTIPSPSKDILTRLVGHIDFIHDRKLVLASVSRAQISLCELIETGLKHGSSWAVWGWRTVNGPLLLGRQASRDWVGTPLSSIRCHIGACDDFLVGLGIIIPMNG